MYVMVIGSRGIPNVQGGVEKHCEQLYPILAKYGCTIELCGRSPFLHEKLSIYKAVKVRRLYAPDPKYKGLEAFLNSLVGTIYAGIKRPDILHIHAVGPSVFTLWARLLGLRVVVTHHGFDYNREKWNFFARRVLELGELLGMKFAHQRIAVSETIRNHVMQKHRAESITIPNGVVISTPPNTKKALDIYQLEKRKYFLIVSRLVPEKRQDDLIKAFLALTTEKWKLVIVGSLNPSDEYIEKIKKLSRQNENIILTNFLKGRVLQELYAHAGCFVLPSSHEGLPIVVLEALSYGVPVLASDIEANNEIGLGAENYFKVGDVETLANKMSIIANNQDNHPINRQNIIDHAKRYSWKSIAEETLRVYRNCI